MSNARAQGPPRPDFRVSAEGLRWRCDPARFSFETTRELEDCPIEIIGQERAQQALRLGLALRSEGYNIFVSGEVGSGRSTVVRQMLDETPKDDVTPDDVVYVHNFREPDEPLRLILPPGRGRALAASIEALIASLRADLRKLFVSESYRRRRAEVVEAAAARQKALLRDFDKHVEKEGFQLVQVQMGPVVRPKLVPVVAGNPVEMDQLQRLSDEGQFRSEDYEALKHKRTELTAELELLSRQVQELERELRRQIEQMDRELAAPLVEQAIEELRRADSAPGFAEWLEQVGEDLLDNLGQLHDEEEGEQEDDESLRPERYEVNVLVDHSHTQGRPVIWETAPSYRNLFGTIEKTKTESGDWETDHTRIKAGSLLRANGGFLVLDALDVLDEAGVWPALKRTLRHRRLEIQSFEPLLLFSGASLKPQPIPIDVKVVMIGTRHIYHLLYALDEDFKKIFKVKADFAEWTELDDRELMNYACLVAGRCRKDGLPPFRREAVARVVEHGARLAEDQQKLTTRFTEIADLVREAGHEARLEHAPEVRAEHVERALAQRRRRLDRLESWLRARIVDGKVLIDLADRKVGQVNGLAVLDEGDHVFAMPSRITATTAMGRGGIIDIDREADLSGSIHTKGVLILTGFLRWRFAQSRPLALTASLCFEQSYGGVEGDSASAAELYALLSSLAEVPLRQGVAVTGSVNQRGEIQPIGGVNEKIEGFFDLCRVVGLDGTQGVMIPRQNQSQLMLRDDVVEEVRRQRFHVWAVSSVEQGLEVLTDLPVGERTIEGGYPPDSLFGRVEAKLARFAEQGIRFGTADLGLAGG